MTSAVDSDQNERLASLESNSSALGRNLDLVRTDLAEHQAECAEHWLSQSAHNASVTVQLKGILWMLGAGIVVGLGVLAELYVTLRA